MESFHFVSGKEGGEAVEERGGNRGGEEEEKKERRRGRRRFSAYTCTTVRAREQ